ncbi:glycoside hydrolase family 88 protein [Rhizoctonia solani]|uniref:Glycoside hydrolase family 88 protein n=1 Tax=Rhizoctonia solani TaxID=456999 RepID=A0A8H8NWH0_9AGAM|nr:glycoside hydrolase family 88 protein [Rhizoctonia solani]QRW20118.1 glycoside hydrolase family 88 protein [Rhizoctonia solani]
MMWSLSLLSSVLFLHRSLALAPTYSDSIFSPYIVEKYDRIEADRWTSGFLPGSFYLLEERKGLCPNNEALNSVDWLTYGRHWSNGLIPLQGGNAQEHDQGFLAIPYLEELKINPTNLLFKAADLSGNQTLIDMAISHANKTIANHAQSSDITLTRATRKTAPGHEVKLGVYMDSPKCSTSPINHYLDAARRMAKVFLSRLPSDGIPPYDFDAPTPNRPADTSAATIAAEGLFILAEAEAYVSSNVVQSITPPHPIHNPEQNVTGEDYYKEQGVKLLVHNFKFALQPTWDSILSNGTSNARRNNTNTGLVYGDYYAIQAGNTMLKLGLASC